MISSRDNNSKSIESLFYILLEAPDSASREQILGHLAVKIPFGEHPGRYIEQIKDASMRIEIREAYSRRLFEERLRLDWERIMERYPHELNLDLGAFMISRLSGDVDLTYPGFIRDIHKLSVPLKQKLGEMDMLDHRGRLEILRHYIYEDLGFQGNMENYYIPENSYLNNVIRTKKGIPVSLALLILLISRRASLPLYGVNLPGHFIVKYSTDNFKIYMDPFNNGTLLSEEECFQFLSWQGIDPFPAYLSRTPPSSIIIRMYRNLINHFANEGEATQERLLRSHFHMLLDRYMK